MHSGNKPARSRAQEELLLLNRAISAATDGIAITDCSTPDNPLVYVNRGFEQLTGYAAQEVLGRNPHMLQGPETVPASIAELREAIRNGRSWTVEILNYRQDGGKYWNRLSISPALNDAGQATHYIGVKSDITEKKQMERLKTDPVFTVSHELGTPLTSLRGFAEPMLERDYPPEKQRHFIGIIEHEATRLMELIHDFLDLQRTESGRETDHFQALAPAEMVAGAVRLFRPMTTHRLVCDADPALPPVRADEARIHQVLNNLLSNAVKFSPRGGEVRIRVREAGEMIEFQVSDQGIGIPEEALGKLFSRFYRVDNTEMRAIGGTGLGLELVKRIVEAHNSRVGVTSEFGCGSTFSFTLPRADRCAAGEDQPPLPST